MLHRFPTIVHPTDFSDSSIEAFVCALLIRLLMRSKLYLVHVGESKDPHEDDGFPPGMLLIAMPTAGRHGFLDAKCGSTMERVVRHAPCPVLSVPAS